MKHSDLNRSELEELVIDEHRATLAGDIRFVFLRHLAAGPVVSASCFRLIEASRAQLLDLIERGLPVYGVTTGFGDSSSRLIPRELSVQLQRNLVAYLLCGTGDALPRQACRATMLFTLRALCRGYSGVTTALVERLRQFLERDWIPVIPREGSLGASGDLIPLAYIARVLQGEGDVFDPDVNGQDRVVPVRTLMIAAGVEPYDLDVKEGLALVNGTAAMSGLALVNLNEASFLIDVACLTTAWLCISLKGRVESFESLVNERAKSHQGQGRIARGIRDLLRAESYRSTPLHQLRLNADGTLEALQDRYSLRCAPQVLGPVLETSRLALQWLETEINGTGDNPLVDPGRSPDEALAMGGNFFGGYLAHGMDYLKIALAHVADLMDRQLLSLVDERSNRGLYPNLAAWDRIPDHERHLHHGVKGLHQAVGALTSEIMAKAMPNSIFSRSSESHNQDKISLGMSAAVQCHDMLDQLFTVSAIYLICLAQALDLRGVRLTGHLSSRFYEMVRRRVPFISHDQPLEHHVRNLAVDLRREAAAHPGGIGGLAT